MNFKKILYKISGEYLSSNISLHDVDRANKIAKDIAQALKFDILLSIVVGGGNIFRGINSCTIKRTTGDYMGMMSTIINAIFLRDILHFHGVDAIVVSSLAISNIAENYTQDFVQKQFESKKVIIYAGGVGSPFFSTDTCAVLRALEIGCDIMLKGTSVDGVYDSDPKKNLNAKKFDSISHQDVINLNLKVMDITSIVLAKDNNLPIYVCSIKDKVLPLTKFLNGENKSFTRIG